VCFGSMKRSPPQFKGYFALSVARNLPAGLQFIRGTRIYLILPAALSPGVYSASNRNEYRKYLKKIIFLGSKVRPVRRSDNFAADCLDNVGSLPSHSPIGLHGLLRRVMRKMHLSRLVANL
jgi:hypothetical protein